MPSLGFGELVLIFLIIVLIFGAGKLPQLGDGMGRAVRNFRRAMSGKDEIDVTPREKLAEGDAPKRDA